MWQGDLDEALRDTATRRGPAGFTFDDLARVGQRHRARIGDIAEWLARARSSGVLEELGFDAGAGPLGAGPRRYRIATGAPEQRREVQAPPARTG